MRKFCVYSSLLLLIAALPIVFNSLFVLPKVRADINMFREDQGWGLVTLPLDFPYLIHILGLGAFLSGLIGLVFSLKLRKWKWVSEGLVAKLVGSISLLMFFLSSWVSLATWAGCFSVNDSYRARISIYDSTLREFTLKAEADERIEELRKRFDRYYRELGVELIEVEDVSTLSRKDRHAHWRSVHRVLSEETSEDGFDVTKVARLLATAGKIRNGDDDFSVGSLRMTSFFNKLTGGELRTDSMVFNWIEQSGEARWKSYKIYDVEIPHEG